MKDTLTQAEKRKARNIALLIVLGLMLLAALLLWAAGWDVWQPKGQLPPESDELLHAAAGMDAITVEATLDAAKKQLTAVQTLTIRNRTGDTQSSVVLRSYTGAYLSEDTSPAATDELFDSCYPEGFSTGGLLLDSAEVDGASVAYAWQDTARTVLTLPLAAPWQPDETRQVTLRYHVHIPTCASRFGVHDGLWMLGNVFPTPTVWENGAWRTDAYSSIGDPFLSECANWTVRLTMPEGFRAAATGYAEPMHTKDGVVYAFTAHAVRDFALVVSDQYEMATGMEEGVMVIACARERARAREMLRYAKQSLRCYEEHYGAFLYPSLTVAEVDFPFSGMEYPRMGMISSRMVTKGGQTLEFSIAHEVAHQWWYAMVGSDSVNQPWQDESLCEYALMDYIGRYYGEDSRNSAAYQRIETALRMTIPRDVTPGSPISYFSDLTEYTQIVYRRGAALWMALETHLGKAGLDAALQNYQTSFRFALATREDLTQILSEHAGMDLTELMADYLDTHMS